MPHPLLLRNIPSINIEHRARTYDALVQWLAGLSRDVDTEARRVLTQYYDFSGTYLKRRCDGALLLGGWDWRREIASPRQRLSNEHFNAYEKWLPFEWWILPTDEEGTHQSGMEKVFSSSLGIPEVYWYLLIEVWYKEQGAEFNISRQMWESEALGYDVFWNVYPIVHGSIVDGEVYRTNVLNASEMIIHNDDVTSEESARKKMDNKGRTLNKLLGKLVAKWDELVLNEGAYTWGWINQILSQVAYNRYRKESIMSRLPRNEWQKKFNERICKTLEKATGKPWQHLKKDGCFYPRCMLRSYYVQEETGIEDAPFDCVITWTKAKRFERMKETNQILWASNANMWVASYCMFNIKVSNGIIAPDGKLGYTTVTKGITPTFWREHVSCQKCGTVVEKRDILTDEDLDMNVCKFCGSVKKENTRPTATTVMGAYHGHRGWRFYYQRTKEDNPKCFCFGMEIEMHNKMDNTENSAKDAAWSIYRQQIKINPEWNEAYFERDGSLATGGLEMITNPMSLEFHRRYWTAMLPVMREYCTGWNTEEFNGTDSSRNNYGIHITFSRKYWTDLQLARLIKFMDNTSNKVFVRAIAQRKAIYSGEVLAENKRFLKDKVQFQGKGKIGTAQNRYVPVNVKDKLVELRFFRTTLNTQSFLKNIEFVAAFHDWVSSTGYNDRADAFIDWLCGNKLAHRKYENLIGYLSREKFPCKGGHLLNPWKVRMETMKKEQLSLFPLEQPRPHKDEVLEKDIELCV